MSIRLAAVCLSICLSTHPSIYRNDEQPAPVIEPLRKIKIEGKKRTENEQRSSLRCQPLGTVSFRSFVRSLSLSFSYPSLF